MINFVSKYMWHHKAYPSSLADFSQFSCIFRVSAPVTCRIWRASPGTYVFCDVTSFWHNDVISEIITCTCGWSHDLLGIKGSHLKGGGFCSQDLGLGPFKGHTGSNVSGASLWSEPTICNCKECLSCVLSTMCVLIHASISFQESLGVLHTP